MSSPQSPIGGRASFGKKAEEYIARHVVKLGWKVLERNYHSRFGEIDIVADDRGEIVFIEVKARRGTAFGTPLESVTETKLEKIAMTAHEYLASKGWEERPWRLDVFAVTQKNGTLVADHLPNFG